MVLYMELSNPTGYYLGGELVKGQLCIINKTTYEAKEISISLIGYAEVFWHKTRPKDESYSRKETLVHQTTHVVGTNTEYPFEFQLPLRVPSSFKSKHGTISYKIYAETKSTLSCPSEHTSIPLNITGISQLQYPAPLSMHGSYKRGKMQIRLTLLTPVAAPGEVLKLRCDLLNDKGRIIRRVKLMILMHKFYTITTHSKRESKKLIQVDFPGLRSGNREQSGYTELMVRPGLPPSGLGGFCRLIDVQYSVRVQVDTDKRENTLSAELPLIIGRYEHPNLLQPQNLPTVIVSYPSSIVISPRNEDINQPPPSYNEVMDQGKYEFPVLKNWESNYCSKQIEKPLQIQGKLINFHSSYQLPSLTYGWKVP